MYECRLMYVGYMCIRYMCKCVGIYVLVCIVLIVYYVSYVCYIECIGLYMYYVVQ